MMTIAKDRWDAVLHRLRFALSGALLSTLPGEEDAAQVLEQSRARVLAARDALERAPRPSRRRPYRRCRE